MKLIFKLFGILMILLGVSLLIKPEVIIGLIENNMENTSLYIFAIVVRLVLGVLFMVGARESKYPSVFKFLGSLFIIAAIIFIFMGHESFQNFITPLITYVKPYVPISGLFSIAFGGFLLYAFSKKKELEQEIN